MNFLIHRRIAICMLFIALTLLGYVSYRQLPVELLPDAELPMLYVQVSYPQESDPSYIESEVVIPLEGAVATVGGIEQSQCSVNSRNATLQIRFKPGVNLKVTSLKLQEKINAFSATLPSGFSLQVQKVNTSRMGNGFMTLQALGSGGVDRVRSVVDQEIRPALEQVDGVASVQVYGGREKAIEVQLDPEACRALNLTPARIASLLSQNTQEKSFVGYADDPDRRYFVHVNTPYAQVADLENVVVAPGPVRLKDIATLFFGRKEESSYSRVDGKDAVSITLLNDAQANLIDLSHRVNEAIDRMNAACAPLDVAIVVQEDSAAVMESNIDQIISLAVTGGLLAVLILWLFLKNIRLVFFIALSIPISVYTAFHVFYAAGISINSLTLVGMALAVGMLLDNSVVVLENIYRLSGAGRSPEESVVQGTREVWRSILAATLTTVTVFLPFLFSDHFLVRLIGNHVGVSIISTLLISLLVALLFIPMATYQILKRRKGKSVFYEKVSVVQRAIQVYLIFLKTSMRHPAAVVTGAVVLLFLSLMLALTMSGNAAREVEADRFEIRVDMPAGSTLESTDKLVRILEDRLADFPEKKELISRVGETQAVLTLVLRPEYREIGNRSIGDIKSDVQRKFSDLRQASIYVTDPFGSGSGGALQGLESFMRMMGVGNNNERIVIRGADYDRMLQVAEELRYNLEKQDCIAYSWASFGGRQPEIQLRFDPVLLTAYDISRGGISAGFSALDADFSAGVPFRIDDELYDVVIRNRLPERTDSIVGKKPDRTVDDLRAVRIADGKGTLHRLDAIATLGYGRGQADIQRENQDKQLVIYYAFRQGEQLPKEMLQEYRDEIDRLVGSYNLPAGVAVEVVHEEDSFADFKFLMLAAFILIFLILASVFESLVTPFVLLFSIPLAAIGSLLALLLTGSSLLNANTLTGFLILLGVVVNNGIILIDYANILRNRGYRRNRALITAGLSRIRPILITSVTTIVAMLPLAMGQSEYAGAIGAPFAITVIGGLACSALLTLVLIPTVCMGLENALAWYRGLPRAVHALHLLLFFAGVFLIARRVDGLLWQSLSLVVLLVALPGLTWFIRASLRRANSRLIDPGAEIRITVQNLVKIYDRPGRILRQWNGGLQLRRRLGLAGEYRSLAELARVSWLPAVIAFLAYFAFFYLHGKFWMLLFTGAVYGTSLTFWQKTDRYLRHRFGDRRWVRWLDGAVRWGLPIGLLATFYRKTGSFGLSLFVALLGGFGIAVYYTSRYLYGRSVNIERVGGRLASWKRSWFRLAKSIPVIGKQRRPFKALRGVSFEIRTGMFGLLGPNGAGKSTLMRIVCGILEPSYGSIWINGLDTRTYREELQSLIGFLPQEFGTYEHMTSWEFLDYQGMLRGLTDEKVRRERLEYVLKSVHMYERRDETIGSFSGGMKQRIGIALILLHLPRILVVDEPTAGLDPRERIRFRNLLVELSKERVVIFSTHIIEDISSSCSQVAVVDRGELKYFGDPSDMVTMATGKVWQFDVGREAFEQELDKTRIVLHIQHGDRIRVRYLSSDQPRPNAELLEPNLEDAYLCLLKNLR